jgi:hypothetical protein
MNAAAWAGLVLAAAFALGAVRSARDLRSLRGARVVLQLVVCALLWLCLFPPSMQQRFRSGELVVLTPGATPAQRSALHATSDVVALPGVEASRAIERAPDLATALRRHPDARRLRIVGAGLPSRDLDAARSLVGAFEQSPLPRGLVELEAPRSVRAGNAWRVSGRVEGAAQARVELRDPSAAVVAAATVDEQGRFALEAYAKDEGFAMFALRVQDGRGAQVDEASLPLLVRRGEPLRLLVLAAAPDAELKYLRRWAVDAGLRIDSRLGLSEGVALTEGAPALDDAGLRAADVAIIDERAWAALTAVQKKSLLDAVDDGMGLLLRVTGALPPSVADDWAALGFRIEPATGEAVAVRLDRALGSAGAGPALARQAISVQAPDATALLRDDDAEPLALWRAQARGRLGLWWLADSWRLALSGERSRHANVWSRTLATLARARAAAEPRIPRDLRFDQRAVLCGIADGDRVEDAAGVGVALLVDAGSTCAAWWPRHAGRHTLSSAGARWPLDVLASDATSPLAIATRQRATRALLGTLDAGAESARATPLPRWPFFLGWLAAIALLWWLERRSAPATFASVQPEHEHLAVDLRRRPDR